jgi:hypothetical protein
MILWHVGPLLGNVRNNRTGVAGGVFYVVRIYPLLGNGCVFCSVVRQCGGGAEYPHRDPASRRRRRKGKSQIWDSKIWSWVSRDSDPRMTELSRASSIYKRQTRPLVREGVIQKLDRNSQTVMKISCHEPQMGLDTKIYWLTDRQTQCDFDLKKMTVQFSRSSVVRWKPACEEKT